eukprot:CAMPEP_0194059282 /NCGR_PEP_ID=MMETSP0009_2-20130614/68577_1 /TAXON_ID=210454 /ORGANISM="Grammatophora oceanica, Strain CCMP 410" /LENGTH=274 /DNA_ID=CAMNT_0038709761 /DNA_START=46 /DNA_END=866 /DNA_ORIENTATION=+
MRSYLALFLLFLTRVSAFPTQPGSCNEDNPLGGFHLTRAPSATEGSGGIGDGGFELVFGDVPLFDMAGVVNVVEANEMIELRVLSSNTDGFFRGFLIRISDFGDMIDDATMILQPRDSDAQRLGACNSMNIPSLAHTQNFNKTSIVGFFEYPMPVSENPIRLEVTVVVANNAGEGSVWYYSDFRLEVDSEVTSPPTRSPVNIPPALPPISPPPIPLVPVAPPVDPPIVAPVVPPTSIPTGSPTASPTSSPTGSPVVAETPAPTTAPTSSPTGIP